MDIYDAVASLYDEYGSMIGVYGVGIEIIDDKEYLLVYGRPFALARIPSNYMGYEVHKKPRLFRPREIIIIPRMALDMAKELSKVGGVPLSKVVRSKQLNRYIEKLKEGYIVEFK